MSKPLSGDAEIAARWRPHRAARRPPQCRYGEPGFTGPCWVEAPFSFVNTGYSPACGTCKGNPTSTKPPTPQEILRYSANPSQE